MQAVLCCKRGGHGPRHSLRRPWELGTRTYATSFCIVCWLFVNDIINRTLKMGQKTCFWIMRTLNKVCLSNLSGTLVVKYPDSFVCLTLCSISLPIKYNLIMQYEARVNALRASNCLWNVLYLPSDVLCTSWCTVSSSPGSCVLKKKQILNLITRCKFLQILGVSYWKWSATLCRKMVGWIWVH